MADTVERFQEQINQYLDLWRENGSPSRSGFEQAADELKTWREERGIPGLWKIPPVMVTATLDDAMGFGLQLIHRVSEAAGLKVHPLGLLQKSEAIIAGCQKHQPLILGMTVLQFDSEEELGTVGHNLPEGTRLVVGGPIFKSDPEIARRTAVDFVAEDAAAFLGYLLGLAAHP